MSKYSIGLDFGTNSCRSLIVNISNGEELASHVFNYPSGEAGVIVDQANPHLARQNPADYLIGIEVTIKEALKEARRKNPDFVPEDVIGIGVDTTGSSPMPVDREGQALCFNDKFKDNPTAMVWLWKDHTGHAGVTDPDKIKRSVCAAGHKAMYNDGWGGLPDEEFLNELSPKLGKVRNSLYQKAYPAEEKIGNLSKEWADKLGLSTNVAIAVGAFDAHMGAVGAGVTTGTLVKILGTSTCDIMIWPNKESIADIPGVCGIVDGSVLGGFYGIEAGQSAVGDIFLWFVNHLVPEKYGKTQEEKFKNLESAAAKLVPGETGLLALDWNNGNRTILVDVRLTGLLLGQTLHTQPHEIYRALVESTAFGALAIIDRIESNGVKIDEIVNCGGLAIKNAMLMQIYADITGRPMKVSRSEQTPALGAAMFGAISAGKEISGYANISEAQKAMTGVSKVYEPIQKNHEVYKKLYALYMQLHDGFGTKSAAGNMYNVMKDLLTIRDSIREGKA
jgi:L-ribulokinase